MKINLSYIFKTKQLKKKKSNMNCIKKIITKQVK